MREKDMEELRSLVAEATARLHLSAWTIDITFDETDPVPKENDNGDPAAVCRTGYPYLMAELRVRPSFWTKSPDRKRHIVYHELIHIILQPIKMQQCDAIDGKVVTWNAIVNENERVCDWFARIATESRP